MPKEVTKRLWQDDKGLDLVSVIDGRDTITVHACDCSPERAGELIVAMRRALEVVTKPLAEAAIGKESP